MNVSVSHVVVVNKSATFYQYCSFAFKEVSPLFATTHTLYRA